MAALSCVGVFLCCFFFRMDRKLFRPDGKMNEGKNRPINKIKNLRRCKIKTGTGNQSDSLPRTQPELQWDGLRRSKHMNIMAKSKSRFKSSSEPMARLKNLYLQNLSTSSDNYFPKN